MARHFAPARSFDPPPSWSAPQAQHEASVPTNHFRKGAAGGWRAYFSRAQMTAMEKKCTAKLAGTGLDFDYGHDCKKSSPAVCERTHGHAHT